MAINVYSCVSSERRFVFDIFYPEDENITLFCLELETFNNNVFSKGWGLSFEFKILEFGFYTAWLIKEQKQ